MNYKAMNRIAVFTGTRAEYGLMKHLIKSINDDKELELQLIVSGSHLSKFHGETVNEILKDGIEPKAYIPISLDKDPPKSMAFLSAEVIIGLEKFINNLKPNLLILLGDRYETFAVAATMHLMNIPVAHIHGGETTLGAVDDKLRHAITQLSSWHFTAAEAYKNKVISMGISEKRVFQFGPMILDGIRRNKYITKNNFEKITGYTFSRKNIVVTYHPETLSEDKGLSGFNYLLLAIKESDCNVLFTSPNADEGGDLLLKTLKEFVKSDKSRYFHIPSLGQMKYLNALKLFDGVVGNSSSGIIEAPLMKIPVLNIGKRQAGRIRFGIVEDVDADLVAVKNGLKRILKNSYMSSIKNDNFKSLDSPSFKILEWIKSQMNKSYH